MDRPSLKKPIALIGLPASGKTTVAQRLAGLLELPAQDLDRAIAREAGRDIPSIFAEEGEDGFRERESRALSLAADGETNVLATGGGVVLRPENRRVLKEKFFTVWLLVSPETAARRSTGGSRPLLEGHDAETRMRQLASERTPLYEECAALRMDTESRNPNEVAEAIYDAVR